MNIHTIEPERPTVSSIIDATCEIYGLRRCELIGEQRNSKFILPRHVAMYVACKSTLCSLPTIGKVFRRHHTSVKHGKDRIAALVEAGDSRALEAVLALADKLGIEAPLPASISGEMIDGVPQMFYKGADRERANAHGQLVESSDTTTGDNHAD